MNHSNIWVLKIDGAKCQGHNRCYALAPQLVDVDEWGQAFVLSGGVVPVELHETAKLLVANCPEFAITLTPVVELTSDE